MRRLIDAESLKELFPDNGEGSWTYNATVKAYIDAQPTIELEPCGDTISRKAAIEDVRDGVYTGSKIRRWLKSLPSIQPKGTRLSTACLMCKKPAVTFNTEDDIPYTNYSYCEDCLRKGLKLLREQKKNLQAQPERKTGHWVKSDMQRWYDVWLCSECGEKTDSAVMSKPRYKYCPMCGAKMEEGREDG